MTVSSHTTTVAADADRWAADDGAFAQALSNLAADMHRTGDNDTYAVECDYSDDRGDDDLVITGSRVIAIYIPAIGRAMIHTNGGDEWTDATSVEDALNRYASDAMAN